MFSGLKTKKQNLLSIYGHTRTIDIDKSSSSNSDDPDTEDCCSDDILNDDDDCKDPRHLYKKIKAASIKSGLNSSLEYTLLNNLCVDESFKINLLLKH